jgi:hypothetical protein
MKNIILVLAVLFSFQSFSQEIKIEKGKYYVDGKQISSRETKELLKVNLPALRKFKQGKSKEGNGGLLVGLGTALTVVDFVKGQVSDLKYPGVATYIGAGLLVASIPVLVGKNKKMRDGIEMYNSGLKTNGQIDTDFELNAISNQNGYGLQIRF